MSAESTQVSFRATSLVKVEAGLCSIHLADSTVTGDHALQTAISIQHCDGRSGSSAVCELASTTEAMGCTGAGVP